MNCFRRLRGIVSLRTLSVAGWTACLLATLWVQQSQGAEQRSRRAETVPVSAASAVSRDVPIELKTFGTAEAYSTVSVQSEVAGMLLTIHFQKGQEVKKGDLLFTIDPRQFQAELARAESVLAQDKAQAEFAKNDAVRSAELKAKGIAGESEYEKMQAAAEALAATVRGDEAAVETAKLQLEHCTIRSPIDGRVGNLLVNEGNIVKERDSQLVTIKQTRPIQVLFAISQKALGSLRQLMSKGTLTVKAFLQNEDVPEIGELTFVDNAVDKATGTFQVGAVFANTAERLWPGQYVNVTLVLTVLKDAVLVPAKAVQNGPSGKFVFVIKKDMTVEQRPVSTGAVDGDDITIETGLSAGEQVVTDGQFLLSPGAKVEIKPEVKPIPQNTAPAAAPKSEKAQGAAK